MLHYLKKKIAYAFLTLFGVITVIFILFSVLPGDPARMMLGQNSNSEQLAQMKRKYGFDQPIAKQYLYYLNDLSPLSFHSISTDDYSYFNPKNYNGFKILSTSKFNMVVKWPYLRYSFARPGKLVSDILTETLPNTIVLAVAAITLAMLLGIFLGTVAALNQDNWIDRVIQIVSTMGMSVPSFFSAIIFAWLFGYVWGDWTNLNMTGSLYTIDDFGNGRYVEWKNLILPAIVLGIRPLAVVSQLMRNSLLEVISQDYIRTAKAKGLSTIKIVKNHAIKNALNPVITALSGWFASMLAGAVFVEFVFGWNGLGKEIVSALNTLDLPVIMGSVLVIALFFIIIQTLVDVLYAWLDPKVKLD